MGYTSEFEWDAMEDHCYFPEWADRPPARGSLHEVERNSYLAGGYAEEFGHRAPAMPAQAPIPVEGDGEWRVQIGGLHPGYPECPRPLDREPLAAGSRFGPDHRPATRQDQPLGESAGYRVVRVGEEAGGRSRHRLWTPWRAYRIRRSRLPLG
jgi:hypothetical protein